jgi:hypothetical protein
MRFSKASKQKTAKNMPAGQTKALETKDIQ